MKARPLFAVVLLGLFLTVTAWGQSPMISYQGKLTDAHGDPLNATVSIRFFIYSQQTGGSSLWSETQSSVTVQNGIFNVLLGSITDFPSNLFDGSDRWLGLKVGGDAEMSPRQQIVSVGYALRATVADRLDEGDLEVTGNVYASGTIQSGNSITVDGINNKISSDDDLELSVSSGRALRLEPNNESPNIIGGYMGNSVASGIGGATIGGGGTSWAPNQINGSQGTISGGRGNLADGSLATIGGGFDNSVSGEVGSIGGGENNNVTGGRATVGGGDSNTASGPNATVSGGSANSASGSGSTVGGGDNNMASAVLATIGGGGGNSVTWQFGTVGGGQNNNVAGSHATNGGGYTNTTGANYATVPGGTENVASGSYSFAAGQRAKANHDGTFVWADQTSADFASTGPSQFLIRASGGVGIGTNNPATMLDVNGSVTATTYYGDGSNLTGISGPSSEESLRIIRGSLNADGSIAAGSGFTITKAGAGRYDITFNTPFSGTPTITATYKVTNTVTSRMAMVTNVGSTSARVVVTNAGGTSSVDGDCCFIVIGPR